MNSIWTNTFYQEQPALAWLYRLDLSSFYNGIVDKAGMLSQAVVDVSLGKRENNYTDVYYAGIKRKIFTRAENSSEFTIKFNEDKYYRISTILENIFMIANHNQYYPDSTGDSPYTMGTGYTDGQQIIKVNVYDPSSISEIDSMEYPLLQWEFRGCQLVSLDDMPFNYESTETITRRATFCYQYMIFRNRETLQAENGQKKVEKIEKAQASKEQGQGA